MFHSRRFGICSLPSFATAEPIPHPTLTHPKPSYLGDEATHYTSVGPEHEVAMDLWTPGSPGDPWDTPRRPQETLGDPWNTPGDPKKLQKRINVSTSSEGESEDIRNPTKINQTILRLVRASRVATIRIFLDNQSFSSATGQETGTHLSNSLSS